MPNSDELTRMRQFAFAVSPSLSSARAKKQPSPQSSRRRKTNPGVQGVQHNRQCTCFHLPMPMSLNLAPCRSQRPCVPARHCPSAACSSWRPLHLCEKRVSIFACSLKQQSTRRANHPQDSLLRAEANPTDWQLTSKSWHPISKSWHPISKSWHPISKSWHNSRRIAKRPRIYAIQTGV